MRSSKKGFNYLLKDKPIRRPIQQMRLKVMNYLTILDWMNTTNQKRERAMYKSLRPYLALIVKIRQERTIQIRVRLGNRKNHRLLQQTLSKLKKDGIS